MKNSILSFLFLASTFVTTNAQIPNNTFEIWNDMGNYDNPDQWGTLNNTTDPSGVYTATKAGSAGNFYLKLTSQTIGPAVFNGVAVCGKLDSITMQPISGFAYNERPETFDGKWQHMIYGNSQGSLTVTLTRWNSTSQIRETIATASQTLSGMAMNWTNFSIPFTYQNLYFPDSCIIVLKASGNNPTNNDYLWVDDLAFNGTVPGNTGIDDLDYSNLSFSIYPNPVSEKMEILLISETSAHVTITLSDMQGKIVFSRLVENTRPDEKITLDVSVFPSGCYLVKISDDHKIQSRVVVID